MTTHTIPQAMAAQLDRVNGDPKRLLQKLLEANQTIDLLHAKIARLEAERGDCIESTPSPFTRRAGEGFTRTVIDNRPALTLKQVASQLNVNYHSAARYARKGAWELTKVNGTVYVYADQPITKPVSKRRSKKAA